MSKREILLAIAKDHLNEYLSVEWFADNYHDTFFYTPDVSGASLELDYHLIEGLLWDYKVTFRPGDAGDGTYRKIAIGVTIRNLYKADAFNRFLQEGQPSDDGKGVVYSEVFEKIDLKLGNGGSWCRGNSKLAKIFVLERKKEKSKTNKISKVELKGWNRNIPFYQRVRKDIVDELRPQCCVMLGIHGDSENVFIEIDHKDGRKDDASYCDVKAQKKEWFQPLCKAANDMKRQKCIECKETDIRWSASSIPGYEDFPFYEGDSKYTKEQKCVGCYLYDPVAFRAAYKEFIKSQVE